MPEWITCARNWMTWYHMHFPSSTSLWRYCSMLFCENHQQTAVRVLLVRRRTTHLSASASGKCVTYHTLFALDWKTRGALVHEVGKSDVTEEPQEWKKKKKRDDHVILEPVVSSKVLYLHLSNTTANIMRGGARACQKKRKSLIIAQARSSKGNRSQASKRARMLKLRRKYRVVHSWVTTEVHSCALRLASGSGAATHRGEVAQAQRNHEEMLHIVCYAQTL